MTFSFNFFVHENCNLFLKISLSTSSLQLVLNINCPAARWFTHDVSHRYNSQYGLISALKSRTPALLYLLTHYVMQLHDVKDYHQIIKLTSINIFTS